MKKLKTSIAVTTAVFSVLSSSYAAAATVDEVLSIRHQCSSTIKIWAQDMTTAQLNDSCAQLSQQETDFHNRLSTAYVPVADDYNEDLRVVVFDDYNQYDTYGYTFFNINTNNGGMYIEGNPADMNNQASFYAHEADWLRPDFEIWNLRHEYIHYLEGRYVSYGGFNHFPSNMVWWSEGLAEYLSLGTNNQKAVDMVQSLRNKRRRPSLNNIFNTTYRDKTDMVYRWSYLAIRFLFERHNDEVLAMTQHLKADDFSGYSSYLDTFAGYNGEFNSWLDSLLASAKSTSTRQRSKTNTQQTDREEFFLRHSQRHGEN